MNATDPRILVIGEALIDVLPDRQGGKEVPGGSPTNVAVTLGRLGAAPRLATVLAPDARGQVVRGWLNASGVEIDSPPAVSERTSTAEVTLDASGRASYLFDLDWSLPPVAGVEHADVVHTGSIATVLDPGARSVMQALTAARGNALVTFDPNARPGITPDADLARNRVEAIVHLSDVVKVSDDDLRWYYPAADPIDVARTWGAAGPVLVVVTLGSNGCVIVRNGVATHIPTQRVEVVDTNGAGDTFMGALIYALISEGVHGPQSRRRLREMPLAQVFRVVRWAATAAAVTVSRSGANPPTLSDLEPYLAAAR